VKGKKITRGHNILGGNIRKARLRVAPSLTQSDLAARLTARGFPMDRSTFTRIENGEKYLRDFEIKAIARILRVKVGSLFGE